MSSEQFHFSVPGHITFLDGYLDAVGRGLTTDTELWALTSRDATGVVSADRVLSAAVRERTVVENWSKEFGSLVEDFLNLDQRARLGFYLIDYICWFKEFTQPAECFKLDCEPLSPGTIDQAVYLLRLEGDQQVLLLFQRIDKVRQSTLERFDLGELPAKVK